MGKQRPDRILPSDAWTLILAVKQRVRSGRKVCDPLSLHADPSGPPRVTETKEPDALLSVNNDGTWQAQARISTEVVQLLDLYLPIALISADRPATVAHLGQSLDGRIATESFDSYYVTGEANIHHLHRMRALCDAVIVGAGTVEQDDPQLTVRHVPGENPVRVVVDARRRLAGGYRVFTDGAAPTRLVCRADGAAESGPKGADLLEIETEGPDLPPAAIVAALRGQGLGALFVEGGGVTVSRFLAAGVLDRLQVAVAPMIIGSGRPSFTLPVIDKLSGALRPPCRRFDMGEDVLFDFDLQGQGA